MHGHVHEHVQFMQQREQHLEGHGRHEEVGQVVIRGSYEGRSGVQGSPGYSS